MCHGSNTGLGWMAVIVNISSGVEIVGIRVKLVIPGYLVGIVG